MHIRRKNELVTTRWSGGTTTELFILPETARYAERNFDLRISTATVEDERSEFTLLPGYSRILMVLDGTLSMHHKTADGVIEQTLGTFEQGAFSGNWKTTGFGKVTDFNVIFRNSFTAAVNYKHLPTGIGVELPVRGVCCIVFVLTGMVAYGSVQCVAGEVVILEKNTVERWVSSGETQLAIVEVSLSAG